MSYSFSRVATGLFLGLAVSSVPLVAGAADNSAAAPDANTEVAEVDQLESQAFQAIRDGEFDKTSQLLAQAASLDQQDPQVQKMAQWAQQFDSEEAKFDKQREQEFEKNVADIHKLLDHGLPDYAIGAAAAAYLRAPNQEEFRHEKWIDNLVNQVAADAQKAQDNQQWFAAEEMYADLSGLDPTKPEWKDDLNEVTRHMELLALYTPQYFRSLRDDYDKASESAEKLLGDSGSLPPTTQPDDDNSEFSIDWHDTVRGISPSMLPDALFDAEEDYFRDAPYTKLMTGGIEGMQMVADTRGLEKTFPGLGDAQKRAAFLADLGVAQEEVKQLSGDDQESDVRRIIAELEQDNLNTINLPDEV
ncbi:MAG TPA: hypothetical protein VMD30_01420, partial [Tepidisphaeraceae bacterium]|nr:hypothetical protein [Tepidisphaeraceae bacterium]